MEKLLKYTEFINENQKFNDYLESLPFWREFIQKFNMNRNRIRREKNLDLYRKSKGIDLSHDDEPQIQFLDEWDMEQIHYNWGMKYAKPQNYGQTGSNPIKFEGLKDPEIGDLLITFRGYAWLFKPDEDYNYRFSSSAGWKHDTENMWDDLGYTDFFLRGYVFKIEPGEIPVVIRKKLSRNIRPNFLSGETGYKSRTQEPTYDSGKPFG
jgi:hypothetical protein